MDFDFGEVGTVCVWFIHLGGERRIRRIYKSKERETRSKCVMGVLEEMDEEKMKKEDFQELLG